MGTVRFNCGSKCSMKLDVYEQNQIYAILQEINYEKRSPIVKQQATIPIIQPNFQILHNVQMMNGIPYIHASPQQPPPPQPPRHHHQNRQRRVQHQHPQQHRYHGPPSHHGHGLHRPYHPRHAHHHSHAQQQGQYPTLGPIDLMVDPSQPMHANNGNKKDDVEGIVDTGSNDSNSSSSGDSIPAANVTPSNVAALPPSSFPIGHISPFPIIKIQQQNLPHLPPFVTTSNGQSNGHYTRSPNNVKYAPPPPPPPSNGPCQYWVIIPIQPPILPYNHRPPSHHHHHTHTHHHAHH